MYKQTLITDYYKSDKKTIKYKFKFDPNTWYCIKCGRDLGPMNPRQLCKKLYCELD